MADNKVKFNLKNAHYALLTVDDDGNYSYGTPVAMPGSVSLSLDANGEPENFYADGMVKAKTGNETDSTAYDAWYDAVYLPTVTEETDSTDSSDEDTTDDSTEES